MSANVFAPLRSDAFMSTRSSRYLGVQWMLVDYKFMGTTGMTRCLTHCLLPSHTGDRSAQAAAAAAPSHMAQNGAEHRDFPPLLRDQNSGTGRGEVGGGGSNSSGVAAAQPVQLPSRGLDQASKVGCAGVAT